MTTNRIGLKNHWMNTTWNKSPSSTTHAPKPQVKKDGWYQNSYATQRDNTTKWSGGWGTGAADSRCVTHRRPPIGQIAS